ncbi:hypothetical protein M0R45_005429 [Rubus argutus]|uniref:Uncharacterized protein n=1 Tax=Rubus argutus TaxID=59490 RepID=A0AAW1YMF3_RUBAR
MNFERPSSRDGRYTVAESADQDSTEPQQEERVSCGVENFTATNGVGESFAELTAEDIVGREFAALDDAENWYRMYATALGFETRLQRVTRGIGGRITRRRLVSANTASTLLRQIAGLTSIATEQSLKACDKILRLKRDSELALKTKEAEVAALKRELAECQRELELVKSADKLGYRTIEEVGGNPQKQIKNDNCSRGQSPEGGADIQHLFSLGGRKTGFAPDRDTEFDSSKRKRR